MKHYSPLVLMHWFKNFTGKSESSFVSREILNRLPRSITIQFLSEFDDEGNPIIFICSPEHEGLISEARTRMEAIENAQDAILTHFDIPGGCALLVEFDIEDISQSSLAAGDAESIIVQQFKVKELSHA